MRKRDLEGIIQLCCEVGEIVHPAEALEHFLAGVAKVVGGDVVSLLAVDAEYGFYRTCTGAVHGLDDSQMAIVQQWFFNPDEPVRDPVNRALQQSGRPWDVRTRRSLVDDAVWNANDFAHEKRAALGLEDVLVAVRPLGDMSVVLPVHRGTGARPFSEEDVERLRLLSDASAWFFESLATAGLLVPRHRRPPLPPRLQNTLDLLLTGSSEKEIAARLNCRTSTVHKYVELIYRAFGVSSRPALMARWIVRPERRYRGVGFEAVSPQRGGR